jgi:hypothetical protein
MDQNSSAQLAMTPGKRSSPKTRLQELIGEALEIAKAQREDLSRRIPEVAYEWPPWPFWDWDPLGAAVSKEVGTTGQSVSDIVWRLKRFHYPYELGAKNPKTFYQYAQSNGVLNLLTSAPLLSDIRRFWWAQLYDSYQAKLGKKSPYGYPLAFHRDLLFQLSNHLNHIERLAAKHHVPAAWFKEYRSATLKQLLREAAIYYPEVQFRLVPANQLRTPLRKIEAQVALFHTLHTALKQKGFDSRKFCYQLTAVLCSPREHIKKNNELSPHPLPSAQTSNGGINAREQGRGKS